MELSLSIIVILLVSGLVVGFINTLAGGGSAISLTVFMALGLPVQVANGTNRVAILMQNLSSTATFSRKRMLDWRSGVRLGIPAIVGSVAGAQVAATVDERIFQICLAAVMVSVLVFTLLGDRLLKRGGDAIERVTPLHYFVFFLIGIYCGYIFVGTGFLLLLSTMGLLHLGIVKSNVIKNFIILLAIPFSLLVFVLNGDVNWMFGLVHGAGNMVGAFLASHYAIGWGTRFLRWFMVAVVLVCLADVLGIISIGVVVGGLVR
ncbi:MAG: sulfite exporter TauE/SafE family protein [Alistipes sp.]|jgi:uncharacterized membrane protein YfcA|nr:sulfite exporter TauE/SafE family protein [Alistipes sp.]